MMDIKKDQASMVYKFFDKKSSGSSGKMKLNKIKNQLKNYLLIIKNFKRRRVQSSFKDNIWCVDLADMQLISKYNRGTRVLSCVIDIFVKYTWVVPSKDKKGATTVNAFQSILNDKKRKLNKICVDKGSEFYDRSINSWLEENYIEVYSTHNEEIFVVTEKLLKAERVQFTNT